MVVLKIKYHRLTVFDKLAEAIQNYIGLIFYSTIILFQYFILAKVILFAET